MKVNTFRISALFERKFNLMPIGEKIVLQYTQASETF